VKHVGPSGNVLLIRARDAEGKCIATESTLDSIRCGVWGNASFRSHQNLRPNEAAIGMPFVTEGRGVTVYDWGGEGTYKESMVVFRHRVPWFTMSRYQMSAHYGTRLAICCAQTEISCWLHGERSQRDDATSG